MANHPGDFVAKARKMSATDEQKRRGLFRNDAVWADGKRDDYIMVDHEKDAITVCHVEVKGKKRRRRASAWELAPVFWPG